MTAPLTALVLVNLIPLFGVLFFGWSLFSVVTLYWVENLVIGLFNIPKMIICSPDPEALAAATSNQAGNSANLPPEMNTSTAHHALKFFMVPFFVVHYGGFCAGHGFFIFGLLGRDASFSGPAGMFSGLPGMVGYVMSSGGSWFVAGLVISHGISFVTNFLGKGEWHRATLPQLMMAPYSRIVVLHVAILLGAFAVMLLGTPIGMLILLILGKTLLDVKMHRRSHAKMNSAA